MMQQLKKFVTTYYLNITFAIGLGAMLGSLYFSEVLTLAPCVLCWYQRILMYPQALISAVAILSKDQRAYKYNLALAVPGVLIAGYHYFLQRTGGDNAFGSCSIATPCSAIEVEWLGFITIPFLSLLGFIAITLVNYLAWRWSKKD
jgi:disulfide bond formation protein DsbB